MRYKKAISVDKLAKFINVHRATLVSWLCHYSLSQYVYHDTDRNNKSVLMFNLNNRSISLLRKYLSRKNKKYLNYFDKNFSN